MSTIFQLEDALVEFIVQNTSEFRLRSNSESEELIAPNVWSGFIPRDEVGSIAADGVTSYPAIIVSVHSGTQAQDHETVMVSILIGTYDSDLDQQGGRDCMNIVQRLKDRFREVDILRERFPLRLPLDWQVNKHYRSLGGTNTFPYFFGEMQLAFELPVMMTQYDADIGTGDTTPGRLNIGLPIIDES